MDIFKLLHDHACFCNGFLPGAAVALTCTAVTTSLCSTPLVPAAVRLLLLFAGLGLGLLWLLFVWSVRPIEYLRDNPYSKAKCGLQDKQDGVFFEWIAIPGSRSLPVLHIDEPLDEDVPGRALRARLVGMKIAPFLHAARWRLWVYQKLMKTVVGQSTLDMLWDQLQGPFFGFRAELEALVEGVHAGVPRCSLLRSWDARDLFRLHLMPDVHTFLTEHNPLSTVSKRILVAMSKRRDLVSVGCSVLMNKHGFYRNMDWPSLGLLGTLTLFVRRKYPNGATSLEVGMPGILGVITCMVQRVSAEKVDGSGPKQNDLVVLCMNVTKANSFYSWPTPVADGNGDSRKRRLPSCLFNRQLMIKAATCNVNVIDDNFCDVVGAEPFGPFHLSCGAFYQADWPDDSPHSDTLRGRTIHFFQSESGRHEERRFPSNDKSVSSYLLTCNGNLGDSALEESSAQGPLIGSSTYIVSARDVLKTNKRTRAVRSNSALAAENGSACLQLGTVNNFETVYLLAFEAGGSVELRVDNAFAASASAFKLPPECFGGPTLDEH